ncbi:glycosyltransferase family 2 protein [Roseibacillus persicicus]|uniref:glycosyltransferase family 2 protein n=1 Tax=Roseibacillus persicicus TaxID=454148 RepID=UPI00280C96CC|nr:glycosyltransferase family 2 protein [Roseibacillus persicicus]MDQ8190597.1 glycosyltransferase family 2 protein [Roseibacillus persicicus]
MQKIYSRDNLDQVPALSVITVCRNSEETICSCLDSVNKQTLKDVEHVIVDGDSDDATKEMILEFAESSSKKISKFVSGSDTGIYDAMNKGVNLSRGEWIYFLNSDDHFFSSDTLSKIFANKKELHDYDIIFGANLLYDKENGCCSMHSPQNVSPQRFLAGGIHQQAYFVRRSLFEKIGMFDEGFRLCGDIDWLSRSLEEEPRIFYSNVLIAVFEKGGASSDFQLVKKEHRSVEKSLMCYPKWVVTKIQIKIYRSVAKIWHFLTPGFLKEFN